MKVGSASRARRHDAKLRLSYVTEAPSWKPSYRVVVGKGGKVELQGWAIVDNTSGEDWKRREARRGLELGAVVPLRPEGAPPRPARDAARQRSLRPGAADGRRLVRAAGRARREPPRRRRRDATTSSRRPSATSMRRARPSATRGGSRRTRRRAPAARPWASPRPRRDGARPASGDARGAGGSTPPADPDRSAWPSRCAATANTIVVEGYAGRRRGQERRLARSREPPARAARAQRRRPERVVALGKGEQPGRGGGARVVEAPNRRRAQKDGDQGRAKAGTDGEQPGAAARDRRGTATRSARRTSSRRRR